MDKNGRIIYENPLSCESDIKGFIMEGSADVYFKDNKMCMRNVYEMGGNEEANFVFWCPVDFPSDIVIEWNFRPINEPGLAILFFSAKGIGGEDIFCDRLNLRDGRYDKYHSGDINAFHISYFRRKWDRERCFHTCNLRKSQGFDLVAQGADPIPDTVDCKDTYKMTVSKINNVIDFYIDDLHIFNFKDNGKTYGDFLGGGKLGFRQMSPLVAEYNNLKVYGI